MLDLSHSFLRMRPTSDAQSKRSLNTWIVQISSVLEMHGRSAYLGSPCRSENVAADNLISGWPVEKLQIKGWDADYVVKSGAPIYHPVRGPVDAIEPMAKYNIAIDVIDRQAEMAELRHEVAADEIASGQWHPTQMKISFDGGAITCPVRYINGPVAGDWYVQPITGMILWHDGSDYRVGYVVCCVNSEKTVAEVVLRAPTNPFKAKSIRAGRAVATVTNLLHCVLGGLAKYDDFVEVVKLPNPELQLLRAA